jgi:hypothetical protein
MFQTYYHGIIRKYIILFGTLFNDIYINRRGKSTDEDYVQTIRVPLSYGPKEKFLARTDGDPSFTRPTAIVLPRMSFEIVDIAYSGDRRLPKINKIVKTDANNPGQMTYAYNPVPYDITIELSVMTKNADDGTQIVEQILPYFAPDFTATINVLPALDVKLDIPISLNTVTYQDTYEGDFISRRAIIWNLNFTIKGYLFGPTKTGSIVNMANTNIFADVTPGANISLDNTSTIPDERVRVLPGLTAANTPTSDSANSIPTGDIKASDNYGFITDFLGVPEDE